MLKKIKWWVIDMWQPVLIGMVIAAAIIFLYVFQLGSLTSGLSQAEIDYVNSASSMLKIFEEPVFLPHKLLTWLSVKTFGLSAFAVRLPSVVFALAAITGGIIIMRQLFSQRTTILVSIVLVTSSWLLSVARLALPNSAFLISVPAFGLCYWFYKSRKRYFTLPVLIASLAISVYIPAFLWLVIGLVIQQRQAIRLELRHIKTWYLIMCASILVVLLVPLVYATLLSVNQLLLVLGLPTELAAIKAFGTNVFNVFRNIFALNNSGPLFTVGRMPLLDVFTSVLVLLGIYSQRFERTRWKITMAIAVLFFIVIIGVGGSVTTTILLPFVYLLAAYGVAFLFNQWFSVFPKNPIARALATIMMTLSVVTISYYHINKYFIAWPHTPETRQTFSESLLE